MGSTIRFCHLTPDSSLGLAPLFVAMTRQLAHDCGGSGICRAVALNDDDVQIAPPVRRALQNTNIGARNVLCGVGVQPLTLDKSCSTCG